MDELGRSWMLLEQLRMEQHYMGKNFKIFDIAPEVPEHLQQKASQLTCSCWGCANLRSAAGCGTN